MNGTLPLYSRCTSIVPPITPLPENSFDFSKIKRELPQMPSSCANNLSSNSFLPMADGQLNGPPTAFRELDLHPTIESNDVEEWKPVNLFELSNSLSLEARVYEAGLVLKRTMQLRSPGLIKERHIQRSVRHSGGKSQKLLRF